MYCRCVDVATIAGAVPLPALSFTATRTAASWRAVLCAATGRKRRYTGRLPVTREANIVARVIFKE
jgi:hypothetical protein